MRILVVEDDRKIASFLTGGFRQNGFAVDHAGDGQWFYLPGDKFGQLRSVAMDQQGNLLIVENDIGYVRRIDFQRLSP